MQHSCVEMILCVLWPELLLFYLRRYLSRFPVFLAPVLLRFPVSCIRGIKQECQLGSVI